jgi:hypothetical protein
MCCVIFAKIVSLMNSKKRSLGDSVEEETNSVNVVTEKDKGIDESEVHHLPLKKQYSHDRSSPTRSQSLKSPVKDFYGDSSSSLGNSPSKLTSDVKTTRHESTPVYSNAQEPEQVHYQYTVLHFCYCVIKE